ncbi:hypothetical protein Z950_1526 [Sulfitobacter mediterraneus KCTC 32188]|nr:hypothetical protein Z950_1526 [Sulfitobacter mediterraneus KCTC 32188]
MRSGHGHLLAQNLRCVKRWQGKYRRATGSPQHFRVKVMQADLASGSAL